MRSFRMWHLAQASLGIVQWVGIAILLSPIIIDRTGSGALLGQVMAVIGAAGLLAPLIGATADKLSCHRLFQKLALCIHFIAVLTLYFAETTSFIYWTVGLMIGIGSVALLVLNPTFIMAGSKNQKEEGQSLASLFQCQFFGIIVTGLLIAAAEHFLIEPEEQLLILAALILIVFLIVLAFPPPVIKGKMESDNPVENSQDTLAFSKVVWPLFLAAVFFSMFLSANLMELGPLLIKEVFMVEIGNSALGMAASAFISLFMLESAGRWMQKSGPFKVWYAAQVVYLIVGATFWYTAGKDVPQLLPILLLVVLMQAMCWNDMIIPAIADRLSPASPALTQGLLMLCMAGGFGIGAMLAGMSIDQFGYASVFDLSLIGILIALACIVWLTSLMKSGKPKASIA